MTIQPIGDSGVIVDFADESSNRDELVRRVLRALQALEQAAIPGVTEVTSAYRSVALFLDLRELARAAGDQPIDDFLDQKITSALGATAQSSQSGPRLVNIPVCYEREFAIDLPRVAEQTSLTEAEVIALHASAKYVTVCLGFIPGFPFLSGLPAELNLPRLPTPRTHVPAGSVAFAAGQAGIYPLQSPGGWNIIGRTPIRLFDMEKDPPALLQPGDEVRFQSISRNEFLSLLK